jgi:type III secretion protein W
MDDRVLGPKGISSESSKAIQQQKIQALQATGLRNRIQQTASQKAFLEWCESGFNPIGMRGNFRTLQEITRPSSKKREKSSLSSSQAESEEISESAVESVREIEEAAAKFQKSHSELNDKTLLFLRGRLKTTDSPEDILKKVLDVYPDYTLADEALDFLQKTSTGALAFLIGEAKQLLNKDYSREIKAGKNIKKQALEFSEKGLGSPTALRDLYREITGQPKEPKDLFDELTEKYPFKKLRIVIHFLLHSLGADVKSKGPSISRPELVKLIDDTKTLQGILGVYRFFASRMNLIQSAFSREHLNLSDRLTFDFLSKQFMTLLSERYISPEKVLQLSRSLGVSDNLVAQIILFTQMRDAVRQIAPRLYKSDKQKDELLLSIIEALEDLEEEEEKEEEGPEMKKANGKKDKTEK